MQNQSLSLFVQRKIGVTAALDIQWTPLIMDAYCKIRLNIAHAEKGRQNEHWRRAGNEVIIERSTHVNCTDQSHHFQQLK